LNSKEAGMTTITAIIKVLVAIIVVILIVKLATLSYNYGREVFNQSSMASEGNGIDVTITYLEGESVKELASDLKDAGLIDDTFLFVIQEYFSEYHGLEVAGTYTLSTEMTPDEMLEVIASGTATEVNEDASDVEDNENGVGTAEGEDATTDASTESASEESLDDMEDEEASDGE